MKTIKKLLSEGQINNSKLGRAFYSAGQSFHLLGDQLRTLEKKRTEKRK